MAHLRVTRATTTTRRARTRLARARAGLAAAMTKARKLWRLARRALLAFLAAPLAIRLLVGASVILTVWWIVNWTYQAVRKPTELFFPMSGALSKAPRHATRAGVLRRVRAETVTLQTRRRLNANAEEPDL